MHSKYWFAKWSVAASLLATVSIAYTQIALPPAGIIETVAGTGTQGYSGDGGPALAARMNWGTAIAVDASGNLFVADLSSRIRKVTAATGAIATVAGNGQSGFSGDGGPAAAAEISVTFGIAVDGLGDLFIADYANNRIREVTAANGVIFTIAGDGKAGYSGDGGPAVNAEINHPTGIAVDATGNIYIADSGNHRVRKIAASTGVIATLAGTGTAGYVGDGGPATVAELNFPYSVATDTSGDVYILDRQNACIRKVSTSTGIISTIAGNGTPGFSGDGGPAASAQLGQGNGVAVDSTGNIYLADSSNNRIREVSPATATIATIAGTGAQGWSGDFGPAVAAPLQTIYGIAVDHSGYVYLVQSGNGIIRAIGPGAAQSPSAYNVNVSSSDPTPNMGESVTLTAKITSNLGLPAITGTVSWFDGSAQLGSSKVYGDGTATIVTNLAAAGDKTITATYTGTPSGFGTLSLPIAGFALASQSNAAIKVSAGRSAQVSLNALSYHGFANTVALSCSGLPYPGYCTLSTASLNFTGGATSQPFTLTVYTARQTATAFLADHAGVAIAALFFAPLFLLGIRTRRLRGALGLWILLALGAGGVGTLIGCGGNRALPSPAPAQSSTPTNLASGDYSVTVTATSGNETVSIPVAVTVQ